MVSALQAGGSSRLHRVPAGSALERTGGPRGITALGLRCLTDMTPPQKKTRWPTAPSPHQRAPPQQLPRTPPQAAASPQQLTHVRVVHVGSALLQKVGGVGATRVRHQAAQRLEALIDSTPAPRLGLQQQGRGE